MHLEIEQIVYLHQFHALCAHQAERLLHLPHTGLLAAGPDFGGEKILVAIAEFSGEVTHHAFGFAVHGRGVDYAAAEGSEFEQYLFEFGPLDCFRADVKRIVGADADHRQQLAGFRNRPLNQGFVLCVCGHGQQGSGADSGEVF